MSNVTNKNKVEQINQCKESLLNDAEDISLTKILSSDTCQTILSECREFRDRIYTPIKNCLYVCEASLYPLINHARMLLLVLLWSKLVLARRWPLPILAHTVKRAKECL